MTHHHNLRWDDQPSSTSRIICKKKRAPSDVLLTPINFKQQHKYLCLDIYEVVNLERNMASVLVIDLHVYMQQKITKVLERADHNVIGIYPGRELLGVNLRKRQFDYILVNSDVSPRFKEILAENIEKYQTDCEVVEAIYDKQTLLEIIK